MKSTPLIYFAGPLSGKTVAEVMANITIADRFAYQLVQKCHALGLAVRVLVPHNNTGVWAVTHPGDEQAQRELFMYECLDWVRQSDLVLYLNDSPGSIDERDEAVKCGVTCLDMRTFSLDAAVLWIHAWHKNGEMMSA